MKSALFRFLSTRNQLLLIILITFGVYANSLANGFVWDDHLFLENWPAIRDSKHLGEIFRGAAPPAQDKIYRPVRGLIYVIDYKLWGVNPFFYHLQAILVHLTVTVLTYLITREIVRNLGLIPFNRRLAPIITDKRRYTWLPFFVALLFGIHPIHTETIDYISASMETWGSLFFFGSFYLYLYANDMRMKTVRINANILRVASVGLAVLAFFTYEMTLTLPILLILLEYCFGRERVSGVKKTKFSIFNSQFSILRIAPYFVVAGVYLFVRVVVLGIAARSDYLAYSFFLTMLVMVKVFVRYILLLLVPLNQTTIHNLVGDFPSSMLPYDKLDPVLSQTIFDLDVLLAIITIVALILVAIKLVKTYPIISFGIGWFFITLLPVSYIIPHGGAMAEKYLYILSFGVILAAAAAAAQIGTDLKLIRADVFKQTLVYIGIALFLFYSVSTVARNRVWQNDITLFSDVARKSPNNLLANYTLGFWYGKVGNFEAAKSHYTTAIAKAPQFWEARFNLANIYVRQAKFEMAEQEYGNVLKIYPKNTVAKNILANLPLLIESNQSAQPSDDLVVNYSTKNGLKFNFPASWNIKEEKKTVTLRDADSQLTVEIEEEGKLANQTPNDHVKSQKETLGTLVNERPAQVPNVSEAYVRVWSKPTRLPDGQVSADNKTDERGGILLQFFLFDKGKIVKILVWPADSPQMPTFDQILGSIKIE